MLDFKLSLCNRLYYLYVNSTCYVDLVIRSGVTVYMTGQWLGSILFVISDISVYQVGCTKYTE